MLIGGRTARTARHSCLAVLVCALGYAAGAAELTVDPLRIVLDPKARSVPITVRNAGDTPVVLQARVKAWSQPQGKDQLDDTRDLLVTPAVVEIPAKSSQTLRIGRRVPAQADAREQTYRVLLKEVLPETGPRGTGLRMALELSLPVFVANESLAEARLDWRATRDAEGALFTGTNLGPRHARISLAELHDGSGALVGRWQGVTYILSGATRSFKFKLKPGTSPAGSPLKLRLTTEDGVDETLATLAPAIR